MRPVPAIPGLQSDTVVSIRRATPTALVVDDDAGTRLLAAASLERVGFGVEQSGDGKAALAAFERLRPDLVLLDLLMPGTDGFAVCAEIRRRPGGDRTPILVLTVLDDIGSINRAYEAGATDFVTKPINWTILGHRARYMVRASRAEGAARDGEQRYRDLFDRVPVGLFRIAPDLRLADVNLPIVRMGGFPDRESCLAADIRRLFVDPGDPGRFQALMGDRKIVRHFETRMRTANGRSRWVEINARAVTGGGRILYYEGSLQDIDDRKRAEEALRETTETLQAIIVASPLALAVVNPEGQVTLWNPAAERMFGWSEEEVLGRFPPPVPEDIKEAFEELFRRAFAGERFVNLEARGLRKDGTRISLLASTAPLRDARGAIYGTLGIFTDISDRKKAERALRKSEEFLRTVVANAPVIIWVLDQEGVFTLSEGKGLAALGLSPGEVVGRSIFELYRDAPQLLSDNRRALSGESFTSFVEVGGRVYESLFSPLRGEGGEVAGAIGVATDITERRRTEEALQETNQALQALVRASPLAIMVLDPQGNVRLWNPASVRMFGWSEEEAIGKPNPIVPAENQEEFRALRESVLGGEIIAGADVRRRKKDGSPIDISVFAAPLRDEAGAIRGIMSVIEDITERLRAEDERRTLEDRLRQAQRVEAIGRLAGGIAHDFNNFLTVIEGYCGLLLARMPGAAPERREIEGIRTAGERAAGLVRQLLAFGRRQVLQPKALCLNHVVSGLVPMLRRLIGEDIEIVTVLAPGIWTVRADPGQVEQVVMNLAVNARDAMPEGGRLILETANVRFDRPRFCGRFTVRAGAYAMLAVSDTGVGMDAATKARLFEPFFTTKETGKGTGLGLATAYGIIKQSGGNIFAYSEPGRGATFKIYLPRSAEEGDAVEPAAEIAGPMPARGTETVLVVEDEDGVRDLVCEVLAKKGYTVIAAPDGNAALRLAERHGGPIHLLVTDVIMPRMSGPELARRLLPQRGKMKVLYMSGYTDNALVHQDILGRDVHFLQKPFSSDLLARRVREALESP